MDALPDTAADWSLPSSLQPMPQMIATISGSCCDGWILRPASRCRAFDFTGGFENVVLSIIPNALFTLLWVCFRLPQLARRKPVVDFNVWTSDWLLLARTAFGLVSCVLNLAALIVVVRHHPAPDARCGHVTSSFSVALSVSLPVSVV